MNGMKKADLLEYGLEVFNKEFNQCRGKIYL